MATTMVKAPVNMALDNYSVKFNDPDEMLKFHLERDARDEWIKTKASNLKLRAIPNEPLAAEDIGVQYSLNADPETIRDTMKNTALLISDLDTKHQLVRDTAYKTILERARINGASLGKLATPDLAHVLNLCLATASGDALVLIRDNKVSAVHGGDSSDYSVLPASELLKALISVNDDRFPGNVFVGGYTDHSITTAEWQMPFQAASLLKSYTDALAAHGVAVEKDLTPTIRFLTSDVGTSSAAISASIEDRRGKGIAIGSMMKLRHEGGTTVYDFREKADEAFAKFEDSTKLLTKLLDIDVRNPVNCMKLVCKRLALPKKISFEAVDMFAAQNGDSPATAHDIYCAINEIPFMLKSNSEGQSKIVDIEENIARALHFSKAQWSEYDMPGNVAW